MVQAGNPENVPFHAGASQLCDAPPNPAFERDSPEAGCPSI